MQDDHNFTFGDGVEFEHVPAHPVIQEILEQHRRIIDLNMHILTTWGMTPLVHKGLDPERGQDES